MSPATAWDTLFSAISGGNGDGAGPTVDRFPRCIDIDLAMLVYTSGTTGDPKGVMCCHRDVVSAAKSIIQYLDNRPEDVILNTLSLSHSYGLYQVLMASMFGGTVVLESSFPLPPPRSETHRPGGSHRVSVGPEHGSHDAADGQSRRV